ncbi:GL21143 [Drosophila persimilis]|uniref:GL21143 n=2 Tax=Drosophila persimilis TaxID=7234 RepID=B4HAU0_DROPE|nr:GL21143 [Drosophila persimilis]
MEVEEVPEMVDYRHKLINTESVHDHDPESDPFAKFRQRLPYNTDDPETMEQQKILLEFLISNNICTDEYFEYFIGDPESHKEEATRIVDQLYMVVHAEQSAQEAPMRSEAEAVVEKAPTPEPQPQEQPSDPAVIKPKLFPIFTQRLQPVPQKCTRRKPDTSMRLQSAATGSGQYQIDAGQKAFGARQCQQCGLVYTVHEPEEEKLHREYHNSIHVLRFKGWLDEDIVGVYPEWASDGRIIRINQNAPALRLERLKDLIGVVDKELGYSSYIVPKVFYAFFAIRKQQIVGFCLVQPLTQAHRFIQVDGTDYFSEDTYEASCGVSRIWVSPLNRRQGIASKLMRTVQSHTILGQEISMDRIAFSTPTDDGRALARHITRTDNFLTYDQ